MYLFFKVKLLFISRYKCKKRLLKMLAVSIRKELLFFFDLTLFTVFDHSLAAGPDLVVQP
ncbi:MAG: hypothetical protein PWR27_152 [Petroclostridium sp.]|jgi:hypothetical protein|nr:hypothetical protein [Clostridia bacterium]MDK2809443.1 hypothetical protein [Petroclostridium sp.]